MSEERMDREETFSMADEIELTEKKLLLREKERQNTIRNLWNF